MSTLKVTNIESPSGGGVNAKITDINGGQLSNRNLIINGAMEVAQRSTSVTGVANNSDEGYQTLDRFGVYFGNSAGGVCTVSQSTDVVSNQGLSNSFKVDVTTAATSPSSNHEVYVGHKIESQTVRNSGWNYTSASSYVTLSFWVYSSKAGTYCVSARADDVGAKYYPFEYTLAANTWTKVTHSIPGDSSLVFNNDSGSGLDVRWVLVAGSSRQGGTDGAWGATSTSNMATPNQVNFFDNTSNNFYLTGVQLEFGEVATAFEHRSFGDELLRCMRYFQKIDGTGSGGARVFGHGATRSANNIHIHVPLGVPMRDKPTYSCTGGSVRITHGGNFNDSSSGSVTIGSITPTVHTDGTNFNVTLNYNGNVGSSIAANEGGIHMMSNGTGTVRFDAEL